MSILDELAKIGTSAAQPSQNPGTNANQGQQPITVAPRRMSGEERAERNTPAAPKVDVLSDTLKNLGLLNRDYDAKETEYNAAQDAYTKAMQNAPADVDFDTYLKPYRDRANAAEAALRSSRQNYENAGGIGHSYSGEDRVSDIIKGGLGNSGAGAVNAAGSIYEGNVRGATSDWERELQNLRDQRTEAIQTYRDTLQRYGGDENNRNVRAALRQVQRISENMGMYNKALRGESDLLNTANRLYDTADNLSAASARDVARAKEGLGSVGQFAVDAGVAGVQMLGDAAIGAATGTGMLPVMGLRSYGSAAQEARQAGAGYEGQALYGIGSAAVEMLTEKIADGLAGLAGKGAADDVAEEVIRRLASSDTGRTVLRQLYGMSGEAFEEAISSLSNPALRALYDKGASAKESYGTAEGRKALLADTAYDSLVGAALGGAGSFGSVATGQNAQKNADLRLADAGFGGVDSQVNDAWNVLNGRTTAEQQQARERAAQQRLGILDLIQPTPAATKTTPATPQATTPAVPQPTTPTAEPAIPQNAAETPAEAPQPVTPESVPAEAQTAESAPAQALNQNEAAAQAAASAPIEQPVPVAAAEPAAPAANNGGESGPGLPPTDTTTAESTNGRGQERERGVSKDVRSNPNTDEPLRDSFEQNREMYHQLTNAEVTERANAIIDKGFDAARSEVEQAIGRAKAGMKLPPEIAVAGYQIANEMSRRGDLEAARNLCADIAAELTAGGQLGQIGRLVLNFAPAVRGMTVQKIVDNLNGGLSGSQKASNKAKRGDAPSSSEVTAATEAAKDSAIKKTAERFLERAESDNAEWEPFDFAGSAAKEVANSIKKEIKNSFSPAKEKNAMDTFVRYVKKFAQEKISIEKKKSSPMTATNLLSEVVQNEDLFREVYERAQAEFSKEDSTGYREFVNDYLNTPVGLDGSDARNKIFMRAIAESAANTQENAKYIREQSALGVPTNEIANAIASDLISATKASGDIADSIKEAAVTYVNSIINSDENSETRAGKIVADMMQNIAQKFRDVAVQSDATKQSIENDIADMLAIDYALSPESAKKISESVSNEYERQLSEAIQKELERRFANKPRAQKQQKSLATVLTEAINLGAFNSEYANEAIRKVFGVEGEITIDQSLLKEYVNAEDEAAEADALEKIKQNIADQIPATFRDKFTALRYMNMLGNLKTQGRNIGGNMLMLAATNAKYTVQSVTELAASVLSRGNYQRNTALFTSPELRRQAAADFDANIDEVKGESRYSDVAKQATRSIFEKQTVFGSGESSKWASDLVSKIVGRDVDVKKNVFENTRRVTNWAMDVGDVIFMRNIYTRAFAGWMKAHGITDVSNATAEQVSMARAFAAKEAQEATFHDRNSVSDFAVSFDSGWGKNGFGRFMQKLLQGIQPFRRTPANVGVRAFEYSPLGIIETGVKAVQAYRGSTDADGNLKSTAADVINSAAKNVAGIALMRAGFALAAAGLARGSGDDDDDDLNSFQKMRGAMDYSVKIGGNYVSLSQFAPNAIPFFMGVKLQEFLESSDGDLSLDDFGDILGTLTEPMLEMSMLQGVNDLFEDIADLNGDTDALPSLVANAALKYVSQGLTNTLLGQVEQASEENRQTIYSDTKSRDATVIDRLLGPKMQYQVGKLAAKTPGLDYNQQDYVDAWGRTQSNGSAGARIFNAFINPTYLSGDRSTEVDNELERLHNENADVEGFPNVFPQKRSRSETIGDGIVMTPDEYLQYSKAAGQKKLELVSDFIDSAAYKTLTDTQRAEVIKNLYSFADDLALQGIKRDNGITKQSDYQKLLAGTYSQAGTEKRPPLKEENAGEYIAFDTAYRAAENDGDFRQMGDLLGYYTGLDKNTREVLASKNGYKDLPMLAEFDDPAEYLSTVQSLKDKAAKTDDDFDPKTNAGFETLTSGKMKSQDLDTLAPYALSKTRLPVYETMRAAGFEPKAVFSEMSKADTNGNGNYSQTELFAWLAPIGDLTSEDKQTIWETLNPNGKTPYADYAKKHGGDQSKESAPAATGQPRTTGQTQNVIDYLLNLGRN